MGHISSKPAASDGPEADSLKIFGASGFGQSSGSLSVCQGLSQLQGEVLRQTRSLQQVSNITYDAFLATITELNEISSHFLDSNGKQLVFAVKKGSDSSFLWKATVRIACVKIDAETKNIDSYRCLNLKQFLRVYNSLKTQSAAIREGYSDQESKSQSLEGKVLNRIFMLAAQKHLLLTRGTTHLETILSVLFRILEAWR